MADKSVQHRVEELSSATAQALSASSSMRGLARLWPFLGPAFIAGIAAVADKLDADRVDIGTHGKKGAAALWTQSIGARQPARTLRLVLLISV